MALSPLKQTRAARVLDIAEALFRAQGLRGTTMEAIAAQSGLSKVTLYGYFRDKEAVFSAVADRLAARLEAAVSAALLADGTAADRLIAALWAKHALVAEVVGRSPHAAELLAAQDMGAAGRISALDSRIEARLAIVIAEAGWADPLRLARLLLSATQGVMARAEAEAADCALVVRAILRAAD